MKIFVTIMALAFFIINLNASILSLNLGEKFWEIINIIS